MHGFWFLSFERKVSVKIMFVGNGDASFIEIHFEYRMKRSLLLT